MSNKLNILLQKIKNDPSNAENYEELGKYYLENDILEDAGKQLIASLELNCDNGWSYLYMGNLFYRKEKYELALSYFKCALTIMNGVSVPCWCMAETFEKMQQYDKADEYFNKAVKLEPDNSTSLEKLGKWQQRYLQH